MTDDSDSEYLWKKRHETICKAELSALYHQKRERFFELCDKLGKAGAVIGGSAALWKIGNPEALAWIAGFITISSSLSLVLSFSERSKRHSELARNFRMVIAEIAGAGERHFTEENINTWNGKLCALDATEPPALTGLTVLCQNELSVARGHPDNVHHISRWKLLFVNFFDMPSVSQ